MLGHGQKWLDNIMSALVYCLLVSQPVVGEVPINIPFFNPYRNYYGSYNIIIHPVHTALTSKVINYRIEVASHYRDPQHQVGENYSYLNNFY